MCTYVGLIFLWIAPYFLTLLSSHWLIRILNVLSFLIVLTWATGVAVEIPGTYTSISRQLILALSSIITCYINTIVYIYNNNKIIIQHIVSIRTDQINFMKSILNKLRLCEYVQSFIFNGFNMHLRHFWLYFVCVNIQTMFSRYR